ncbi:MAG: VWA domain-containing protein [Deltaproteobacteria bacterium]|nr:VWA domain-containing protein [Deltaproteobacteria bacterium]
MRYGRTAWVAMVLATTGCSSARAPEAPSSEATNVVAPRREAEAGDAASKAPVAETSGDDRPTAGAPAASEDGVADVKGMPSPSAPTPPAKMDVRPEGAPEAMAVAPSPAGAPSGGATDVPAAAARHRPTHEGGGLAAKRMSTGTSKDEALARDGGSRGATIARSEGSVRAGEWDDNANYREFRRYLASEANRMFRPLDLSSRRFLVVRDSGGAGVINCPVTVRDEAQHEVRLTTTASGRAILFPRAEGLQGQRLDVTASCLGTSVTARVNTVADDGVVDLRLPAVRNAPERTLDLVFVLDTTGSMSEEIDAVKDTIAKVAREVDGKQTAVRIALVEYRDKGDAFVTRIHDFSTDLGAFGRRIQALQAGGGGDTPEHANEGLRVAIDELAWNPGASARLAFLIGDAPPHLDYQDDPGYERSLHRAAARGIQLYTVAASGMDALGQAVWRQTAQYTGATNMFVMRGGAGPQSTGAGDPKSSCGGTQTTYSSANLDQLIVGKIELTQRLLDLDPMRIAGVGQDETAKPCTERLVLAR